MRRAIGGVANRSNSSATSYHDRKLIYRRFDHRVVIRRDHYVTSMPKRLHGDTFLLPPWSIDAEKRGTNRYTNTTIREKCLEKLQNGDYDFEMHQLGELNSGALFDLMELSNNDWEARIGGGRWLDVERSWCFV